MSSLNKVQLIGAYQAGKSLNDVAGEFGVPVSRARKILMEAGGLRSRADGVRLAAKDGKLGRSDPRGPMSAAQREAISAAHKARAETHAAGVSVKPNGYVEFTRGPHKGRSVHVVTIEEAIGRRILPGEHVHHIDGNRSNNDLSNLKLLTASEHMRLHAIENAPHRERTEDGRFA